MFGFIFLFFTARIEPVHMAGHRSGKEEEKKKSKATMTSWHNCEKSPT